jgi:hypothetical protein
MMQKTYDCTFYTGLCACDPEKKVCLAPCQPIGCDSGIHLKGCVYAIDNYTSGDMETESSDT